MHGSYRIPLCRYLTQMAASYMLTSMSAKNRQHVASMLTHSAVNCRVGGSVIQQIDITVESKYKNRNASIPLKIKHTQVIVRTLNKSRPISTPKSHSTQLLHLRFLLVNGTLHPFTLSKPVAFLFLPDSASRWTCTSATGRTRLV